MVDVSNEVQQLFDCDNCRKIFRIKFPYNDGLSEITNENLVEDSVKFTESICSRDNFRFGLIESPTIEFETVDIPNIKGETIECSIEVEGHEDEPINYGTFVVDSCVRQTNLSHRKVTAYGLNVLDTLSAVNEKYLIEKLPSRTNTKYTYDPIKRALTFFNNYADDFWGNNEVYKGTTVDLEEEKWFDALFGDEQPWQIFCHGKINEDVPKPYYREYLCLSIKREGYEIPDNTEDVLLTTKLNVPNQEQIDSIVNDIIQELDQSTSYFRLTEESSINHLKKRIKNICTRGFLWNNSIASASGPANDIIAFNGNIKRNFYLKTDSTISNLKQYIGFANQIRLKIRREVSDGGDVWSPGWDTIFTYETSINDQHSDINSISNDLFGLTSATESRYRQYHGSAGYYYFLRKNDSYADPEFLYSLINGFFELNGWCIGPGGSGSKIISTVSLADYSLYPSNNEVPNSNLYFTERSLHPYQTKSIDYDEKDYTIITVVANYTLGKDNTEESFHYENRTTYEDVNGQIYDLSDNAILNMYIPNTSDTQNRIERLLDNIESLCRKIKYRPLNITVRGLPYLEAGDVINVSTVYETFNTIIMRQTISGITILDQEIEATGGEGY